MKKQDREKQTNTFWAGIKMSAQRGITITALVVTTIGLLILAGVSINFILSEDSLIGNAIRAQEKQKIAAITDALELEKGSVRLEKLSTEIGIDDYLEQAPNDLPSRYQITEIERTSDEDVVYININDEYEYRLEQTDDGDIKIEYQGAIEELTPRIQSSSFSFTTNSITAHVRAKRVNDSGYSGEYKFYIKDDPNGEYELKASNATGDYTFERLTQTITYYVKVEAVNDNGATSVERAITTGTVTPAVGAITYGNVVWNPVTHRASIDVNTNEDKFYIQVQVNGIAADGWTTGSAIAAGITVGQLHHNDTVYMRLWDGVNGGTYASVLIEDKTVPTVTLSQIGTSATNSVTVSAGATFTAKPSVAGTLTATSGNTTYVTITGGASNTATANTAYTITYKGIKITSSAVNISVKIAPTDTTNYSAPANKSFAVTVTQASVTITLGATSGSVNYNSTNTFNIKSSVAGTFTLTSASGTYVKLNTSGSTYDTTKTLTATANSVYTIKYKGMKYKSGTTAITIAFVPTSTNYAAPANKTFNVTVNRITNPTVVTAVTGLTDADTGALVTVTNQQNTPYYAVGTQLTSSNYSSAGSTSIPTVNGRSAGTYTVYYYIAAGGNYNAKSGNVSVTIDVSTVWAQNVGYTPTIDVWNVDNVKDALDDLYDPMLVTDRTGDLVTFNNEPFYVLYESTNRVTLFARSNLNLAATAQSNADYSSTACAFSSTNYWPEEEWMNLNQVSGYTSTDAIGKAKSYANSKGAISGRLLTENEIWYFSDYNYNMLIGYASENEPFVNYWLADAYDDDVWTFDGQWEGTDSVSHDHNGYYGVRPVITVYKSQVPDLY